jgi:hypothetical protein
LLNTKNDEISENVDILTKLEKILKKFEFAENELGKSKSDQTLNSSLNSSFHRKFNKPIPIQPFNKIGLGKKTIKPSNFHPNYSFKESMNDSFDSINSANDFFQKESSFENSNKLNFNSPKKLPLVKTTSLFNNSPKSLNGRSFKNEEK